MHKLELNRLRTWYEFIFGLLLRFVCKSILCVSLLLWNWGGLYRGFSFCCGKGLEGALVMGGCEVLVLGKLLCLVVMEVFVVA